MGRSDSDVYQPGYRPRQVEFCGRGPSRADDCPRP